LDLSNKNITHVTNIDKLINLECLDLSNNKIKSIKDIQGIDKLKNLE